MWEKIKAWFKKNWSVVKTVFKIIAMSVTVIFLFTSFVGMSPETKQKFRLKKKRIQEIKDENAKVIKEANEVLKSSESTSARIRKEKAQRDEEAKKFFPNLILVLMLPFLFVTHPIQAKDITVDTSRGPVTLAVPSQDLEQGFIDMAKLYLEERYSTEDLLSENDKLQTQVDNLKTQLQKTQDELDSTYQLADQIRRTVTRSFVRYFGIGGGVVLPNEISPSAEFGMLFFERFSVGIYAKYPWETGIRFGVYF